MESSLLLLRYKDKRIPQRVYRFLYTIEGMENKISNKVEDGLGRRGG